MKQDVLKLTRFVVCVISIMIELSDTSPEVQVTTTWWVKNHVMVYRVMRIMIFRATEIMRVGVPPTIIRCCEELT